MAKFDVNGKDFGSMLTDIQLKLVRTYKGEIKRTQTGVVAAFPLSFVTVGFDVTLMGFREGIRLLQQIMLSADTVTLTTNYDGAPIKGKFSCTSNKYTEVRDKGEQRTTLSLSLVSDGTNITHESGRAFQIRLGSSSGTVIGTGYLGKVMHFSTSYKKNGVTLPDGNLLVLGDDILTTN